MEDIDGEHRQAFSSKASSKASSKVSSSGAHKRSGIFPQESHSRHAHNPSRMPLRTVEDCMAGNAWRRNVWHYTE